MASVEADFRGFSLSVVPRLSVTERTSIHAKLGVLDWRGRLTPLYAGQSLARPSGRDLLSGLGAEYTLPRGLGILLEVEHTDLLDTVSLGASWHF